MDAMGYSYIIRNQINEFLRKYLPRHSIILKQLGLFTLDGELKLFFFHFFFCLESDSAILFHR